MNNRQRTIVQYVICLGAFLSNLSAGMFNISLIDIAEEYGIAISSAQWIVTAYLLVISVTLPVMGRLGDLRGRRVVHNIGYFVFMAGALFCAFAPSLSWLILLRIVQGIGAAMYQATNMALIVSVFPATQRGRALGLMSTFVAAGSMIGPSLGGMLVQWFSWRTNFMLLAIITAAAFILAQKFIPKDKPDGKANLDLTGASLFAVSLTGLVMALNTGGTWGWSSWPVLILFILFVGAAALFIYWCLYGHNQRHPQQTPFIQLSLFRQMGMSTGILITIASYLAAFSAQLVLPIFLRSELNVEPAIVGLIMMGYPLSLIIAAPLFGSWSDKLGTFPILTAGLQVMTGTLLLLGLLSPSVPLLWLVLLIVLLGGSMGMITSPNNSLVMGSIAKEHLGLISSLLALSRNLGMMLGTVCGGVFMATGAGSMLGYRLVFLVSAVLIIICSVFLLSIYRQQRRQTTVSS